FRAITNSAKVAETCEKLERKIKSNFLVLGVDRLDYSKGIELKLKGFRRLLEKFPDLRGKINLLQIAVPTRTGVASYIDLRRQVELLVGTINGEFGRPGYVPVNYMFSSVREDELHALYRLADCALITSK